VFVTHDPTTKGRSYERWRESVHLYYSDDNFKTEHLQLAAGNSIVKTDHYMFVAKAKSSNEVMIFVSTVDTAFMTFNQVRIPQFFHITDHFTVMDTAQKTVFLYVSDDQVSNPVGNLFVSVNEGTKYSHSLENIVKGNGAVDFEAIESLDGTFLANRFDKKHGLGDHSMSGAIREITEEDIMAEEYFRDQRSHMRTDISSKQMGTHARRKERKGSLEDYEAFNEKIKTYITHNMGATWNLIRAPKEDMRGKPTGCYLEDGCSLHLNMYYENHQIIAPPYAQKTALGLVMAVGNLGQKLELERGARKSTWISRDGGVDWTEVAKVPLIYEFGDHGGLIVASPNVHSTTTIRYSWNEGKTWTNLKVSDVPIYVENIIIEPKSTSQ